ncbi:MAG: hypothetical protein ACR2OX_09895, partial [Methyloligellaceae bacterium]
MAADDDIDQDELAASWGAEIDEDAEDGGGLDDDVAAQWAAMIDDNETDTPQNNEGGAEFSIRMK